MDLVKRSLRLKVSLGIGLVLVLLLVPFNWLQYRIQRNAAIADLSQLAATTGLVAEHSLDGAMLSNNRPAIQTIVDSVAEAPDVRSVFLLNKEAVIAASPGGRMNGQALSTGGEICQACHRFPPETRPHSIVLTSSGQPIFRTMTPIANRPACQGCHSPADRLNGALYVDFSMAGLNERLDRELRAALLASAAIILVSSAALYGLLSWIVITPMEKVALAMKRFSSGFRNARASVPTPDELGLLGSGFNAMAATIQMQEADARRLYSELEARDEVRRQLLGRLTAAREEERRYLARELHDELGQLLTGLSLHLKLGRAAITADPDQAAGHLERAGALIGETIDESHRLIADLRPTVLDDLGLIAALRDELPRRLAPFGIAVDLDTGDADCTLAPDIAITAFRIAQEAVTNIIRHSGARRVRVSVRVDRRGMNMTIEDDGVGLPQETPARDSGAGHGLGILGMQERADALGGRLEVVCRDPCGTEVRLWLPLYSEAGDESNSRIAG